MADGERIMRSYPHQISGGQQQRVVIAMAAAVESPPWLLLDEPPLRSTSPWRRDRGSDSQHLNGVRHAMLYSRTIWAGAETCSRVTVMFPENGEVGSVASVFRGMRPPYTRGLFASMPVPSADKTRPLVSIPGQLRRRARRRAASPDRLRAFVAGRCRRAARSAVIH